MAQLPVTTRTVKRDITIICKVERSHLNDRRIWSISSTPEAGHYSSIQIQFSKMSETGIKLSKRSRASGPKSKAGCQTCKYGATVFFFLPSKEDMLIIYLIRTRHIKCDEIKPNCSRCEAAGFKCDYGYSNFSGHDLLTGGPLISPALGTSRSRTENRYFDYFRHNTMLGLRGFDYQSEFWTEIVLQFSQCCPAVLHAVFALSAFHEQLDSGSANSSGGDRPFLLQYNKSIAHLRSRKSPQPIRFTLTCCVLFICLENAQGNHETALAHLQNGLNILQDWRKEACQTASEERIRISLIEFFRRLDMQATVFLDSRQPQINATSVDEGLEGDRTLSKSFPSLRAAQIALESIEIRLLYVLTTKSNSGLSRKALLGGLSSQFFQWKAAIDTFSIQKKGSMQKEDLQLGVLLGVHFLTMSLMLDIKADMSSTSYNEARFQQVNSLSRSLINSSSSKLKFAADTGIVAPLYFTAMNATNVNVRQQAIDLLHLVKVKEGFWDGGIAGRIAENVSRVKETGRSGIRVTGGIPILAEAHCIKCC